MNRSPQSALHTWNLTHKRVILRADLNVPLTAEGRIIDDMRLRALMPTIDHILDQKGHIILITHMGRPEHPTPALSTAQLIPWFSERGYTISFAKTPAHARTLSTPIVLLENSRFFPGEKNHDPLFAQELAALGDYYVNDGFGVMHRTDCSVVQVPLLFSPQHKTFGFLVEKELKELNSLRYNAKKPFLMIIGGAKIADKIPLIEKMLRIVDAIALCPAIVFTFNQALGIPTGKSLINTDAIPLCATIMRSAQEQKKKLLFPLDYQIATGSLQGPLSYTSSTALRPDEIGISIGPRTIQHWSLPIQQAGTLFFNGLVGFTQRPETLQGSHALIQLIAASHAKSFIAGGDSVAAALKEGSAPHIDYLSSGGGSTITYLAGQELPGLLAVITP